MVSVLERPFPDAQILRILGPSLRRELFERLMLFGGFRMRSIFEPNVPVSRTWRPWMILDDGIHLLILGLVPSTCSLSPHESLIVVPSLGHVNAASPRFVFASNQGFLDGSYAAGGQFFKAAALATSAHTSIFNPQMPLTLQSHRNDPRAFLKHDAY